MASTTALSRFCARKPPATVRSVRPACARIGQAAGEQQAQVLLGGDDGDGLLGRVGRDDHLGEDLDDGLGALPHRAVRFRATMPPKAETGSQRSAFS